MTIGIPKRFSALHQMIVMNVLTEVVLFPKNIAGR